MTESPVVRDAVVMAPYEDRYHRRLVAWVVFEDEASVDELRRQTQTWIERHHTGLRLELRHQGPGTLEGRLGGAWKNHHRVKAIDPDLDYLTWDKGRAGAFTRP